MFGKEHFREIKKKVSYVLSNLLPVIIFLLLSHLAQAKNYYFSSSSGNDSYTSTQAQSSATPWRTISKLNSYFSSFAAGDSILLKCGDIFYGCIAINKSGTSSLPIVISNYGSGVKPIITGFTKLSAWSSLGNGIYQVSVPNAKSTLNLVTLNDVPQALGRYPNADAANGGYLAYESFSGTASITDNELPATPSWTGAEVVIRKKLWVIDRCRITNHTGTTLSYTTPSTYDGTVNYGYFIQDDPRTLDKLGEWYLNKTSKTLQMYFGTATPSSYSIQASTIDTLVIINAKNYININNIDFEGANGNTIYAINSSYINIQNCDINNAGETGIYTIGVTNLLLENNNTNNVLSNGLKITGSTSSDIIIRNCSVKKTGLLVGMGLDNSSSYKGIFAQISNNLLIEYNHVDTTGYTGIEFQGSNVTVKNNVVNYFCYVKDNGGGIYTWAAGTDAAPGPTYTNRLIKDNIVMHAVGAPYGRTSTSLYDDGIFLDGRSMNVDITGNTVFNNGRSGVNLNNPDNVNIKGNTSYNNSNAISFMQWSWGSVNNLIVKDNIFYPKNSDQHTLNYVNQALLQLDTTSVKTELESFGLFDSNYYSTVNQVGFNSDFKSPDGTTFPTSVQSLEGWKVFSNQDLNSKKPYREAPGYLLNKLVGVNLVSNGQYTTTISGTTLYGTSATAIWDNTGKISGGSLRVNFSAPVADKYVKLYSSVGAVSAAKNYVFRFTTLGTTAFGVVNAYLRKTASPYTSLTPVQVHSFGDSAKVHEFIFAAPTKDADASFVIEIEQNSGTTYIDNVELYEADASVYNIDDYLRFEYNDGKAAKSISLGSNYIDEQGTYYPGNIILQPFTSKILVKDTAILRQALAAKSSATAINCFGATSLVTVSATGGIPPYSGTGTFTVAAGTYTYTVKDLTGASATTSVVITQPASVLKVTAAAGTISVSGGSTTVTVAATGGTSPYTGTGSFTNVVAGTYTYTVKDAKGCTVSVTITITQPSALKASATAASINCFGGTTSVTVAATGGVTPYTGTGIFNVSAGTYSYTVKDAAGTSSTASIIITQPSSALKATAVAGTISTYGGTTTVVVSATGGTSPYTGTGTINNVAAGTYSYTITDAKGCITSATVTITQPSSSQISASATTPVINCYGSVANVTVSASGGVSPYTGAGTYAVAAGKGSLKLSFPVVVSGTYTSLYYTIGSISATKNYILKFSTLGTTTGGNLRASIRQTLSPWTVLTAKQPATYGAERVDHEFIFKAPTTESAASFYIEINQNSGITYIDNMAFFEVDANNKLVGSNLIANSSFEAGTSSIIAYSSNNNQSVTWDTTAKINAVYYFTLKDVNNLTATAVVNTTQPAAPLQISVSSGAITTTGGSTTVTVTATGGTAPYTGTGSFTGVKVGTYTYKVTDANGCTSPKTITITQTAARSASLSVSSQTTTSVQSNKSLSITAYPNPSVSAFDLVVQGGSSERIGIAVMNVDGKIVYKITGNTNQNYSFGEDLVTGVYIVQVMQGTTVKTLKLIKVK